MISNPHPLTANRKVNWWGACYRQEANCGLQTVHCQLTGQLDGRSSGALVIPLPPRRRPRPADAFHRPLHEQRPGQAPHLPCPHQDDPRYEGHVRRKRTAAEAFSDGALATTGAARHRRMGCWVLRYSFLCPPPPSQISSLPCLPWHSPLATAVRRFLAFDVLFSASSIFSWSVLTCLLQIHHVLISRVVC